MDPSRTKYMTTEQLMELENLFRLTKHPLQTTRKELAQRLAVSEALIEIWFSHRRARERGMKTQVHQQKVHDENLTPYKFRAGDGLILAEDETQVTVELGGNTKFVNLNRDIGTKIQLKLKVKSWKESVIRPNTGLCFQVTKCDPETSRCSSSTCTTGCPIGNYSPMAVIGVKADAILSFIRTSETTVESGAYGHPTLTRIESATWDDKLFAKIYLPVPHQSFCASLHIIPDYEAMKAVQDSKKDDKNSGEQEKETKSGDTPNSAADGAEEAEKETPLQKLVTRLSVVNRESHEKMISILSSTVEQIESNFKGKMDEEVRGLKDLVQKLEQKFDQRNQGLEEKIASLTRDVQRLQDLLEKEEDESFVKVKATKVRQRKGSECLVCGEKPATTFATPCKHLLYCSDCFDDLMKDIATNESVLMYCEMCGENVMIFDHIKL